MTVRPLRRIAEAAQYFRKSDGEPINNVGGFWIAETAVARPRRQGRGRPRTGLAATRTRPSPQLRHDAHAWAVAVWLRRHG